MTYLDNHRSARDSSHVLRHSVLQIRSSCDRPLVIVEGKDDIAPYSVWFDRIRPNLGVRFIPANGKGKLLKYRKYLTTNRQSNEDSIFFIIDRDFDGYRGYEEGDDIFCTSAYSFENYLVSSKVLVSILNDELQLHSELFAVDEILNTFYKVDVQFLSCIREANSYLREIVVTKKGRNGIEERISRYVDIEFSKVTKIYDISTLESLIPSNDKIAILSEDDSFFDDDCNVFRLQQRGKFYLSFFLRWLDVLADSRRNGSNGLPKNKSINFSLNALSLRALASRSDMPDGLNNFIHHIQNTSLTS